VSIVAGAQPSLLLLLAASVVLLVIACINVAALLLSEATARKQEVATRAALGATPLRVARQFLIESLVLSSLAAALGACLAAIGTRGLVALAPSDLPRLDEIAVDGRVLLFVIGLALFTGVTCGILPATSMARSSSTVAKDLAQAIAARVLDTQ
jgi:ABC-type antimicrobial peptide transport system permease subunit